MMVKNYETAQVMTDDITSDSKLEGVSNFETTKMVLLNVLNGLIGFSNSTQCEFEILEKGPLHILTVLPKKETHFYLVNPYLVRKDYTLDINADDYEILGSPKENLISVFSILTMKNSEAKKEKNKLAFLSITCNLLGPIVINTDNNVACQCINNIGDWSTKHLISNGKKIEST